MCMCEKKTSISVPCTACCQALCFAYTNHEVVSPGNTLGPGQIYDSNRTMLLAALRKEEYCAVDAGIATDRQGHTHVHMHTHTHMHTHHMWFSKSDNRVSTYQLT